MEDSKEITPESKLRHCIYRFTPEISTLAEATLALIRSCFGGAVQLVYDSTKALVIDFSTSEESQDAIFSVVVYPRHVDLCLVESGGLESPKGGPIQPDQREWKHFVAIRNLSTLRDPAVEGLIESALRKAGITPAPSRPDRIIIMSEQR